MLDLHADTASDGGRRGDDGPVTVLIADENRPSLEGYRAALEHHGFSVVAEATDATQAIAAAVRFRPHVCLLELDLPGNGLAAIESIHAELPATRIATLARSSSDDAVIDAIRAGADGCVLRTTAPDRVAVALGALADGEAALPRSITAKLVTELRAAELTLESQQRGSRPLYAPRLVRHFIRRLRSGMPVGLAWESARLRMNSYR
jgi:DNA-binding NarL/FixJ family response regulator